MESAEVHFFSLYSLSRDVLCGQTGSPIGQGLRLVSTCWEAVDSTVRLQPRLLSILA